MEPSKEITIYSSLRFTADKDDRGVYIIDPRTQEYKSGELEVSIHESSVNSSGRVVVSHREAMSFAKYKAIREDVDHMSVDELRAYFPELSPKVEEKTADEKEPTAKSDETTGEADGKPGVKETEQKSPVADKAKTQK